MTTRHASRCSTSRRRKFGPFTAHSKQLVDCTCQRLVLFDGIDGTATATGLAPGWLRPGPISIAWTIASPAKRFQKRMATTPCCGLMSLKTRSTAALPNPLAVAAIPLSQRLFDELPLEPAVLQRIGHAAGKDLSLSGDVSVQ